MQQWKLTYKSKLLDMNERELLSFFEGNRHEFTSVSHRFITQCIWYNHLWYNRGYNWFRAATLRRAGAYRLDVWIIAPYSCYFDANWVKNIYLKFCNFKGGNGDWRCLLGLEFPSEFRKIFEGATSSAWGYPNSISIDFILHQKYSLDDRVQQFLLNVFAIWRRFIL